MITTRRTFLKGVAALSGGIISSHFDLLVIPDIGTKKPFGEWRAVCVNDILRDEYLVRYDAAGKKQQYSVTASLGIKHPLEFDVAEYRDTIHRPMVKLLKNTLKHKRIRRKDLIRLEYPRGYDHPEGFVKLLKNMRYV